MPSPFPELAPCVLAQADVSVYIDFILIMVSEFGTPMLQLVEDKSLTMRL